MPDNFLYEDLDSLSAFGMLKKDIPNYLKDNLNPKFELRSYQEEAFARFFHCFSKDFPGKTHPLYFLFNMATGSGKTLIMAGLILYLYEQGYRNFLFFVNSTNIIEKTKDNFLNQLSSKFLFNETIQFDTKRVAVKSVDNFEDANDNNINVCFTTIQKLHRDMNDEKENSLTYEDFKSKKIVFLADEAHHINTATQQRTGAQGSVFGSWEDTVEGIFLQNRDNLLLEFTATMDFTKNSIIDKYRKKILFHYDLRKFRDGGYSKDVHIVKADFEENDRIIQALILSQYKREIAAHHRINLKPVILFKAQKTIAQSQKNKANFHRLIENLSESDIERIRDRTDIPLIKNAFAFFQNNGITIRQLTEQLHKEFDASRCMSVNDDNEKEKQQLLLNSLEDKDNRIRAVFAVQKLNEGWDVLNLFDIVRCYTTRDSRAGQPGKTTIAEAQLIGRGARYFPFVVNKDDDRYRRKYDGDLTSELRVLESLHYHSINDSRYITEIRDALIKQGVLDGETITKSLLLKDSFKKTKFYKHGLIYLNQRVKNDYAHIRSLSGFGITMRNYAHSAATGKGNIDEVFSEEKISKVQEAPSKNMKVKDIPVHIIRNALSRNPFFFFNSLQRYFPKLLSVRQFMEDDDFLGGLEITIKGTPEDIFSPPNHIMLDAMTGLLAKIESEVHQNAADYVGTEEFFGHSLKSIIKDKELELIKGSERADGDNDFLSNKEWYAFNANYGTDEEKNFVWMLDREMDNLKATYDGIYLIRNERHFKIYNFSDGRAFEPDFVLFLRKKNGNMLSYQMFIEPKGKYLTEHDQWKQDFLQQISEKTKETLLTFKSSKYRLIGLPFYNSTAENEFREKLQEVLED